MSHGNAPICADPLPIECLMHASGFSEAETARSAKPAIAFR
jgi:hypothetical protein